MNAVQVRFSLTPSQRLTQHQRLRQSMVLVGKQARVTAECMTRVRPQIHGSAIVENQKLVEEDMTRGSS